MKLYSWNVNGIRAVIKKGAFQAFLAKHEPDILCLQETKANSGQVEVDLPEYEEYWFSAKKKGYSGTAIFTKETPISVIEGLPLEIAKKYQLQDGYGDTTEEGRVITLEFEGLFLSTVYTPNAKDDLSRIPMRSSWDPAYLEFLSRLKKQKPVIFCGDLNVAHTELDLARPKENKGKKGFTAEERAGFDAYLKEGFSTRSASLRSQRGTTLGGRTLQKLVREILAGESITFWRVRSSSLSLRVPEFTKKLWGQTTVLSHSNYLIFKRKIKV